VIEDLFIIHYYYFFVIESNFHDYSNLFNLYLAKFIDKDSIYKKKIQIYK
jgi:hypothetical protein